MNPLEAVRLSEAVHTGTPGDIEHYCALAEGASSVLELGCGSGRVLEAIAAHGVHATGLELDPAAIEAAHARLDRAPADVKSRITLVQGDMARFDLGQRFDRIFIPFNGIYALLTAPRLASCLRSVRAHLLPGGLFAFDAYAADEFHEYTRPEDYPEDRLEAVAEIEHEGEHLEVLEMSRWDRAKQRIDATYVYVAPDGSVRHEQTIGHRYLRRKQLEPALEKAGFELVSVHGDYDGAPFDPSAGLLVVLARAR